MAQARLSFERLESRITPTHNPAVLVFVDGSSFCSELGTGYLEKTAWQQPLFLTGPCAGNEVKLMLVVGSMDDPLAWLVVPADDGALPTDGIIVEPVSA